MKVNNQDTKHDRNTKHNADTNPDPITGKPGAHPIGTGVGAAGIGVTGTVIGGAVGGPIGAVVGAIIGSIAGGFAGKQVAEQVDPTYEDNYWRENYKQRDYVEAGYDYDTDYAPAYRTGYEGYNRYGASGKSYDDVERDLQADYESNSGNSRLNWQQAKYASQDAWNRSHQTVSRFRRQDNHWRENYQSRPYVESGYDYEHYRPAYMTGYNSYINYGLNRGMTYDEAEPTIRQEYEQTQDHNGLGWEKAKHAIKDAWDRVRDAVSNDDHPDYVGRDDLYAESHQYRNTHR